MDEGGVLSIDFLFATLIALIIIAGMVSMVDSELSRTQAGELGQARMMVNVLQVPSMQHTPMVQGLPLTLHYPLIFPTQLR